MTSLYSNDLHEYGKAANKLDNTGIDERQFFAVEV